MKLEFSDTGITFNASEPCGKCGGSLNGHIAGLTSRRKPMCDACEFNEWKATARSLGAPQG